MAKKIKVGLIGAGRIGRVHAENIRFNIPDAEVVAVADLYSDRIKDWASNLGIKYIFSDSQKIMEDEAIDAVLICSSTDTHSALIIQAARAGKHIFCEKPIDFDLNRIQEALQAVEKAGVKLQIGFQRRFDPSFKKAYDLIGQGKIGDIRVIKITSRDPAPPSLEYIKVSGGLFLDMTIHDFDMVRYLSRSEVTEVYAIGGVMVDKAIGEAGDIDTGIVTLKFANGALGVIDNSRQSLYGYDQRVEVLGSKGCILVGNPPLTHAVLSTEEGFLNDKLQNFFIERYREAYIEEIKAFVDCLLNDKEPPVTGMDGLQPVLIGLAAKKSLFEGRPIPINSLSGGGLET
ncbi:MAG: inositol 2-dehydrogenase [Thermoanaerobacteraceae bacterium]|nr:inositol 2-dehydrogenase [Thermoanaerobacteraceae bacterium]